MNQIKLPFFTRASKNPDFDSPIIGNVFKAADKYWSFGSEKARVVSVLPNAYEAKLVFQEEFPWWFTALKIIACVTIVPIVLLGIKLIHRFIHPIYIDTLPLRTPSPLFMPPNNAPDEARVSPPSTPPSSPSSSDTSSTGASDEYASSPSPSPSPSSSSPAALKESDSESDVSSKKHVTFATVEPIAPVPVKPSFIRVVDGLPVDDCGYVTISTNPVHLTRSLEGTKKEELWEMAQRAETEGKIAYAMLNYIDYALMSRQEDDWDSKGITAVQKSIDLHIAYYGKNLIEDIMGDLSDRFFALVKLIRDNREINATDLPDMLSYVPQLTQRPPLTTPIVSLPESIIPIYQVLGPYTAAVHARQNKRATQEDRYLIADFQIVQKGDPVPAYVFGVFDGHGGSGTAEYLRNHLVEELLAQFNEYPDLSDLAIINVIKRTCVVLNDKWLRSIPRNDDSGSTASVALIVNKAVWFFNVGDSRGILSCDSHVTQSSEDAKPTSPTFMNGILKRGGYVGWNNGWRLGSVLATARAFGDRGAVGLTARPKVLKRDLSQLDPTKNNFIVIASDGLWDVFGSQAAADLINQEIPELKRKPKVEELAYYLTETAAAHLQADNCTTICVNLTPQQQPAAAAASPKDETLVDEKLSIENSPASSTTDRVVGEEHKLVV
jgi:protein phosphatase 1L